MKLLTVISNVILLAASMSPQAMAVPEAGKRAVVRCIAIDPGHGGKDPGAVGNGLQEKAINLGVAFNLVRMLDEMLPVVRLFYTRRDKGVKQAGFLVLWRTPMPSVLTEVGFISNPTEARFLGSAAGQEKVAASIFRAIREYKRLTDSRATALTGSSNGASAAGATVKTAAASKPAAESTPKAAPSFTPSSAPKPTPKPAPKPAQGAASGATQATKRTVFVTPPATRALHEEPEEPGDGKTLFRIQVRSTLVLSLIHI